MESSSKGVLLCSAIVLAAISVPRIVAHGDYRPAHATFYGGPDGSGTFEGACGYGDIQKLGKLDLGLDTAALSTAMYNNGAACGACYEIKCDVAQCPQGCKPNCPPIVVTGNNLCPDSQWCGPPKEHFDLTQCAFLKIAEEKAGVVPVLYRRVPCIRRGGIRFTISPKSNPYFLLVMVWNVGGAGDVTEVSIKGGNDKPFTAMKRNYGQYWESHEQLGGQELSFRVTTSDGLTSTSLCVAPKNWQCGQTFEGLNFT